MTVSFDDITRAEKLAEELHDLTAAMISNSSDYDATRLLKRSEAELMDLRHNLSLIRRLLTEQR